MLCNPPDTKIERVEEHNLCALNYLHYANRRGCCRVMILTFSVAN
jgi:hypothetical protein